MDSCVHLHEIVIPPLSLFSTRRRLLNDNAKFNENIDANVHFNDDNHR